MNAECFKIKVSHIITNFTKLHHCCYNSCICMTDTQCVAAMKKNSYKAINYISVVSSAILLYKHPLILSYHFTIMCHSSCPCSFVVIAKYRYTLPVWHSHALYMRPAPRMQTSKKVFMALNHLTFSVTGLQKII
jgi:hypothetical protein